MSGAKWTNVTRANPCPSCGKHDWCSISPDGKTRKCQRKAPEGVPSREHRAKSGLVCYLFTADTVGSADNAAPKTGVRVAVADMATRHAVYTAVMGAFGAEPLSPEHFAQLRGRGFSNTEIERYGYFTYPADTDARQRCVMAARKALGDMSAERVPGFFREGDDPSVFMTPLEGLAIPVRDTSGRIVAMRVRVEKNGEKKYLWLTGPTAANTVGSSPGALCHVPLHAPARRTGEVRITEGEFKADLATVRTGVLTVSIPGVGQWDSAMEVLRELGARRVRIALDGDAREKPQVAHALQQLAAACAAEGWEVMVETWPARWKGIDDVLVAAEGGPGAVVVHTGAAAWEMVAEIITAAGESPVAGILARARVARLRPRIEADPEVAMSAEGIEAAAALRAFASKLEFSRFADEVKRKVPARAWSNAVRDTERALAAAREPEAPPNPEGLPEVMVTTEEGDVADAVIEALAARATGVYQRGGALVRVITDVLGPMIQTLPKATLRELISRHVRLLTEVSSASGVARLVRIHVPQWLVDGVHARGDWPGIPVLRGVVETAVLRPDGSVLCTAGYDRASGLLLVPNGELPSVPERPTADEVSIAVALLRDLVGDFPFETPAHRAVWMAALLTPFARHAISGPVPLYALDGNLRGVGKSKLTDIIAILFTGRPMPRQPYTPSEEEMKKTVMSVAAAGLPMVLLDNVAGVLGGAALDMILTGEIAQDRRFGRNDEVMRFAATTVWLASGNNLVFGGDLVRRIAFCRLQSPDEKPEERRAFKYPNLLAHVGQHRARYVAAALTILRAYFAAGRPRHNIPAWGSYEAYSEVVRQALVFAGEADPAETREELPDGARDVLEGLIEGWRALYPDGQEVTVAEVLGALTGSEGVRVPSLRTALEEIAGGPLFRMGIDGLTLKVNSVTIAKRLDAHRDRPVNGYCLQKRPRNERGILWRVVSAEVARAEAAASAAGAAGGRASKPQANANSATSENTATRTKAPEKTNSINSSNSDDEEFRP